MSTRREQYNGVWVFTIEGDLAGDAVAEARREVEDAVGRSAGGGVVIDLKNVDFVDSAGLELLCALNRRAEEGGPRLAIARAGGTCARILEITRLSARFDCHADLSRAVAAAR